MRITLKKQLVVGKVYAFTFSRGTRIFIAKELGGDYFLEAHQPSVLIPRFYAGVQKPPQKDSSGLWSFFAMSQRQDASLEEASREQIQLWCKFYGTDSLSKENSEISHHYSIY